MSSSTEEHIPLRISILGDSYSTFAGWIPQGNSTYYPREIDNDVTRVEECWWHLALAALGAQLEKNESWSGSTICHTGYNGEDFQKFSFVTRANRLGNPSMILVCGGTNDSWANAPIGDFSWGDWSNQELYSFRPALAKLLDDLKSHYPQAKIYFILNSGLKAVINDSVHAICDHYQVPYIDLHDFDKRNDHPTALGMKSIANQVVKALPK